jgi:hypothetical protein
MIQVRDEAVCHSCLPALGLPPDAAHDSGNEAQPKQARVSQPARIKARKRQRDSANPLQPPVRLRTGFAFATHASVLPDRQLLPGATQNLWSGARTLGPDHAICGAVQRVCNVGHSRNLPRRVMSRIDDADHARCLVMRAALRRTAAASRQLPASTWAWMGHGTGRAAGMAGRSQGWWRVRSGSGWGLAVRC